MRRQSKSQADGNVRHEPGAASADALPCMTSCTDEGQPPFLNRLLRATAGNVLPLVAAGLLPMLGMIGGAVDMSRAYMVKARLQQACDAGVLAGRKAMANATYDTAAEATASDFFDVNFNEGYQGTTDRSFQSSNPQGTSRVDGVATVNVPTVIMGVFGKDNIPVEVECEAELNVSNSDITFVLDTTGSMGGAIGSTTRIEALRDAVESFYDTLATASTGSNARIRYGFVPYSVGVNVGELIYDTNPTYLVGGTSGDTWSYQSRRPLWLVSSSTSVEEVYPVDIYPSDCYDYGDNRYFDHYATSAWDFHPNPSGDYWVGDTHVTFDYVSSSGTTGTRHSSSYRKCTRRKTETTTVETPVYQAGATFSRYEYMQRTYGVYDFVRSIKSANPAVVLPTRSSTVYDRWDGCIEERNTVTSSSFTYTAGSGIGPDSGGGTAYDLDIDLIPNSTATKWRPYWDEVYYLRNGSRYTVCPAKAQLLSEMTRAQVENYVDALVPSGNTYHDIGLLWGGRISSPEGIFRANVVAAPDNSGTVQRHLIFMTDGELQPYSDYAMAYGIESIDGRVTGGSGSLYDRHRSRFLALCQAIKGKGIRLWAIAFGTSLTTDLQSCASQGSAFHANNADQLEQQFQNIAEQIAELRLTQ